MAWNRDVATPGAILGTQGSARARADHHQPAEVRCSIVTEGLDGAIPESFSVALIRPVIFYGVALIGGTGVFL